MSMSGKKSCSRKTIVGYNTAYNDDDFFKKETAHQLIGWNQKKKKTCRAEMDRSAHHVAPVKRIFTAVSKATSSDKYSHHLLYL